MANTMSTQTALSKQGSPMKTKTVPNNRRKRSSTAVSAEFDGCDFTLSECPELPISIAFVVGDGEWKDRSTAIFAMTIEQAERIHRVLGEMIETRKRQQASNERLDRAEALRTLAGV